MALQEIELSAIPYQILTTTINNQIFTITVRQIGSSIYTDADVDGRTIVQNVRAVNGGSITPWATAYVLSAVEWVDTQGDADPQYDGLGDRWKLVFEASA